MLPSISSIFFSFSACYKDSCQENDHDKNRKSRLKEEVNGEIDSRALPLTYGTSRTKQKSFRRESHQRYTFNELEPSR